MAPLDTTQAETTAEPAHESVDIQKELNNDYLEYAMSVIVSRALPDVRDGLKPVQRRIMYAMNEGGYTRRQSHKKSARIVGDVMGTYHPHGDSAIYEAMARMAQDWAMRVPLIDGQGNFGSIDGDPPAAMRYTEARMSESAHHLLQDIDKDVVDFRPNYDETTQEPVVLPTRLPNLLINGVQHGIAVGMATNIPPHNPSEVLDACLTLIDEPEADVSRLLEIMPGPDFPGGGVIQGRNGFGELYRTGYGRVQIGSVYEIAKAGQGRSAIEITELPYGVNKAKLIEQIAELKNNGKVDEIADVQDASDRHGLCVRAEVKRDGDPDVVVAKLRKQTPFETSITMNATCLDASGRPRQVGLVEMLTSFLDFRRSVIRRRTQHELRQARERLHTVIGLYAAISRVDDVVTTIKNAEDQETAHAALKDMTFTIDDTFAELIRKVDPRVATESGAFQLSDDQVKAILRMQLNRLTGLERNKIADEARELSETVSRCLEILNDSTVLENVLREEINEMRGIAGDERRTRIGESTDPSIDDADLIQRRDIVITRTRRGYIKRTDLDSYRAQRRGGKGKSGMDVREGDVVVSSIVASTHTPFAVFMSNGNVYPLTGFQLPDAPPNGRGKPLVNYLPVQKDDRIVEMLPLPEDKDEAANKQALFVMANGNVRRNELQDFMKLRRNGKRALPSGEDVPSITNIMLAEQHENVLTFTRKGVAAHFPVEEARCVKSQTSLGVKGMLVGKDDEVVDAVVVPGINVTREEARIYLAGGELHYTDPETQAPESKQLDADRMEEIRRQDREIMMVTERGLAKITSMLAFKETRRNSKGVSAIRIKNSQDGLLSALDVTDTNEVIVVTDQGTTVRTTKNEVTQKSRKAGGVALVRLNDNQRLVDVQKPDTD